MLHTAMRLRITEADTSVRPRSTARGTLEQHNAMAGTAQAVDQRQVPEGAGPPHRWVKTWLAAARPPDSAPPGAGRPRSPHRAEAQVRGAIAEEQGQRQDDAAADDPEAPEGALPAQRVEQHAHQGRQPGGAQPPRRPEDAGGEAQPAPEPAADRGHEGHHADGLGQRQQHAEGEEEVPGLPDQPQQDHMPPYSTPPASMRCRAPYRSPSHPLTGAKNAPTT